MITATPHTSAALVADLGFLLRRDLPTEESDPLLVVALRNEPTLRHFDPELVAYWHTDDQGRGRMVELTFDTPTPIDRHYSWGPIEIVDRLGISNTFFSVGGRVRADRVGHALVVTFSSPGPILARGGHSQPYDRLAAELTAFFARVLVPIDFLPGAEAAVGRASPLARYAAFLEYDTHRIGVSELVRDAYGQDVRVVRAEADRLRKRHPADWEDGIALLRQLDLHPGVRTASPASTAG